MINFVPMHNKVVVRRKPTNEYTGFLYIPESAREQNPEGTIVAVGPGVRDTKGERHIMPVSVGDQIIFTKDAGINITVDGEELVLLDESQIISGVKHEY